MNDKITIRELKRALKDERAICLNARTASEQYRRRATKAEQECAEWRKRFDALLQRMPIERPVPF